MIIDHPILGPRDASEFIYLGDACLIDRPDPFDSNADKLFYEYQYLRDNIAGPMQELWYHEQGDRVGWLSQEIPSRMRSQKWNLLVRFLVLEAVRNDSD